MLTQRLQSNQKKQKKRTAIQQTLNTTHDAKKTTSAVNGR